LVLEEAKFRIWAEAVFFFLGEALLKRFSSTRHWAWDACSNAPGGTL
jgi:hypothetical protein